MGTYYVEILNENVSKVLDIVRFWHIGSATILEPVYGQYCTKTIEIKIEPEIMKEIYSDMKVMGIRNYKREVA